MEFNRQFEDYNIYSVLCFGWFELVEDTSWDDYIRKLDLGISCIDFGDDTYEIVDEKKWMLSKIKYGI